MMMTFQEEYGTLPMTLLRTYRRVGVSPADHDQILDLFGYEWSDFIPENVWTAIESFVDAQSSTGLFRFPLYM